MPNQDAIRVVVIDDDEMVSDLTAMFLTQSGYSVHVATTGEKGIQLVRAVLPAVVLCDIEMRGTGGREVVEALRSDVSTRNIPIALMSGRLEPESFASGDAFISKPFSADDIVVTVKRLIASAQSRLKKDTAP